MESLIRSLRRQQLNRLRMDRQRSLDRALRRLVGRRLGARLPALALTDAVYGWGNEGWSADEDYLARVMAEAGKANGSILECGSGLSTLLLATVARQRGVRIHSLEHNEEWRTRVLGALQAHGLSEYSTVHQTSLKNYGEFDWYAMPESLPNDIALVVCDGPPSSTLGGRYGALPVLRSHLAPVCNFLMDDANRPSEIEIMSRWGLEPGIASERHHTRKGYARVTVTTQQQHITY